MEAKILKTLTKDDLVRIITRVTITKEAEAIAEATLGNILREKEHKITDTGVQCSLFGG